MVNQRVLVTGAAGTLGQEAVSRFRLQLHLEVIGTTSSTLNLTWETPRIQGVLDEIQPDIIVNTAAFTGVDAAETDFETAMTVNGNGPKVLAEWALAHGRYLVHISTDYVFDGVKGSPYTPEDAPNPINQYGISKLAGEKAVLESLPESGLVVRTSWLFGPAAKNFVPFVIRAAQSQSPLRIVEDQWGTPTWTGNLCKMLLQVIAEHPVGLLHGCCRGVTTRYEQALHLCEALGASPEFMTPVPTSDFGFPARRPRNTSMESSFDCTLHWQEATEKFLQTQGLLKSHV